MSTPLPINIGATATAPTPQNTPLATSKIAQGLSRPTVGDIPEDQGEDEDADIQERLAKMLQLGLTGGRDMSYLDELPLPQKIRLQALKSVQVQQYDLDAAYKREQLELEKKYLKLNDPLYARRLELISGAGDKPKPDEIEAGEKRSKEDDEEYENIDQNDESLKKEEELKGIPQFWLTALQNHVEISSLITERDEEALKSLANITFKYLDETPGFELTFTFDENEFFEQKTLTKTYIYGQEPSYGGEWVYEKAEGSEITWKDPSKDLTKEFEIKKQRNKATNQTRLVRKAKPTDSFFDFFTVPTTETLRIDEDEDEDTDPADLLQERLEVDHEIGEEFKDKVIPKAVDYFTGKALEYEMDEWDDVDSEDDEDDDDDEDEDDE